MEVQTIQNKIYEIRGQQVMFDFDLAELYEVEARVLNQAVKRNLDSFPIDFMFRLSGNEWKELMSSQTVTTSVSAKRPKTAIPYVFTEHGVTMLASVLKSPKARMMNIAIVRAFIALRKFVIQHTEIVSRLAELEKSVGRHDDELKQIYSAIEQLLEQKKEEDNWRENRERVGFKK